MLQSTVRVPRLDPGRFGTRPIAFLMDEGPIFEYFLALEHLHPRMSPVRLYSLCQFAIHVHMYVKAAGSVDYFVGAVLLNRGGGAAQTGWSC